MQLLSANDATVTVARKQGQAQHNRIGAPIRSDPIEILFDFAPGDAQHHRTTVRAHG
jgi:hypothetical protein